MTRPDLPPSDSIHSIPVRFISVWEGARIGSKAMLDLESGLVSDIEAVDCDTRDDVLIHEEIEFVPTTHFAMATMTQNDHLLVDYDKNISAYRLDSPSHEIVLAAWRADSSSSYLPNDLTSDRAPLSASSQSAAPGAATPAQ
jgi:hypothetical protein